MIRQTLADRIVNAGYGLPEQTVIFLYNQPLGEYAEKFHFGTFKSIPPFTNTFVQIKSDTSQSALDYVGAFLGYDELEKTAWCQMFAVGTRHDGFIGIYPSLFTLVYSDDYILDRVETLSGVDFAPESRGFIILKHDEQFANYVIDRVEAVFSLLHQRREFELVTPTRQIRRQVERKEGKPPSPYFRITVNPNKVQKRYTINQGDGHTKKPHIVRGHFAHYGDDAPLFGKYTGVFWRPSHVRGHGDDNPKAKDYHIILPPSNN